MNDRPADAPHDVATGQPLPQSRVLQRRPFHLVWLIPLVALAVATYLGVRAVRQRGAEIVITFNSAEGMSAGQTKVRHKAVDLGTVQRVALAPDLRTVELHVQMQREANRMLTDHARFWVVRPRLNAGNLTGLDTLISGSYIEIDPGPPDQGSGKAQSSFVGLEEPPAVRSDEPGRTFTLASGRIGSLSSGSPVFFHDIAVGEVLGYDLNDDGQNVAIHAFIRRPYDDYVHEDTRFWNSSGLALKLGAQGVQVQLESLQALLSGGVAFDRPTSSATVPLAKPGATFTLYSDQDSASAAGYKQRLQFTTYVEASVRGLGIGAPVELYGIQIGNVTSVQLQVDSSGTSSRVRIDFEVQPERILPPEQLTHPPLDVARVLVRRGLRVQLRSANFITGQLLLAMDFFPGEPSMDVRQEADRMVLPSMAASGIDSITNGLSAISAKLGSLPLDDIARNLSAALGGVAKLTNGPELQQTLRSLQVAMADVQDVVRKLDAGLAPALKRLPDIAGALQATVDRANRLVGSVDTGYGNSSEFNRNLQRLLGQVSDTARSVRLLADYLGQHPEALLRGRTESGERSR